MNARMPRPIGVVAGVALLAVLASGCWDREEINQRTLVLALGLDRGPRPGMYTVSAQIAVPGGIPLGLGGGATGAGGQARPPAMVIASTGHTVEEALFHLTRRIEWPMFLGHLRLVAISEEIARQGVRPILDTLRRDPQVRRLVWLVVTQGQARRLLEARSPLERVAVFFVANMLETLTRAGNMARIDLGEFGVRLANPGEDPTAPLLRVRGSDVQWRGIAVFSDDRMVGTLDPGETHLALSLRSGGPDRTEMELMVQGSRVRLRNFNRQTRIRPVPQREQPRVSVRVQYEANVAEVEGPLQMSRPEVLHQIERIAASDQRARLRQALRHLQRLGADPLGYGEQFRAFAPQAWKQIEGTDYFRTLPVDIQVRVAIRRVGMVQK
ncbi:MAG: Ger(x)C family spore germination protein [Limnochordaceae bacterium]|nr:Ger(x)C family spore germination protein [Limnochordaceae bacterium]